MNGQPEAAILLVTFNRPDYTKEVIASLRKAQVPKLYIFKDGPRSGNEADKRAGEELLRLFDTIDWSCDVQKYVSDKNLGCGLGVSSAITWAFQKEESLIILEDDCVPSSAFYSFCNSMLERFKEDQRVWVVCGENHYYPDKAFHGYDYLFSRFGYNWGWATWKRCWVHFDFSMQVLPKALEERVFENSMPTKKAAKYYKLKYKKMVGKADQLSFWTAHFGLQIILHQGLMVIPRENLITNIGVDGDHTESLTPYHNIKSSESFVAKRHPSFVMADIKLMKWHYQKRIRFIAGDIPLLFRIRRKLKKMVLNNRRERLVKEHF